MKRWLVVILAVAAWNLVSNTYQSVGAAAQANHPGDVADGSSTCRDAVVGEPTSGAQAENAANCPSGSQLAFQDGSVSPDRSARLLYSDLVRGPADAWLTVWGENIPANARFTCGDERCEPLSFELDPHHPGTDGFAPRQKLVFRTSGHVGLVGANSLPYEVVRGRIIEAKPPAIPRASNGDVIYLREGRYARTVNCGGRRTVWCGDGQSGVSILGYPGEQVVIDCSVGQIDLGTRNVKNITIANLEMDCGDRGPGFSASRVGSRENLRIVGVYLYDARAPHTGGFGAFSATVGLYILGNHTVRTGVPGSNQAHSIYHGGRGLNRDVEIAYNHIENHEGGRAIQIYGHQAGESMTGLTIHHNYVHEFSGNAGILVSHTDGQSGPPNTRCWISDAVVSDNLIIDYAGGSGIHIRGCDANGGGGFEVLRNVVVGRAIRVDFSDDSVILEENCLDRRPEGRYSGDVGRTDYPDCLED